MTPPWHRHKHRERMHRRRAMMRRHREWHHRHHGPYKLHKLMFMVITMNILLAGGTTALLMKLGVIGDDQRYLGLAVLAFFLWGGTGWVSHALVRPLSRVTEVAREIGGGNLSSRVKIGPHQWWRGEIGELADAVDDMAERIEKQLADQRALLAAVSHEIRTPLGHMRVIAELAREGDTSKLAELEREIDEVDTLVDQLLASSRLEFDTLSERKLDVVGDVCVRALERADVDAALLEVDADDTAVRGDPALLARAVGNLIENAERHAGGVTEVRVTGDSEFVRVAVSDRGPGFADGEVERAFEQFHRGTKNAKATHGSLGLGLSLVRRIAEAHGGRAWAENTDDGARVTVEISRRASA